MFPLIGAGFGITLATGSQAEVMFPAVVYWPTREDNAWVLVELVWCPEAEDPTVGRSVASMRDEESHTEADKTRYDDLRQNRREAGNGLGFQQRDGEISNRKDT